MGDVAHSTSRRKVLLAIAAAGLIVIAALGLRVAPLFTGPALPGGANRRQIATASPIVSLGSATTSSFPSP